MKYIIYVLAYIGVVTISVAIGFIAYLVSEYFIKYDSVRGYLDGALTVVAAIAMNNILHKKQNT